MLMLYAHSLLDFGASSRSISRCGILTWFMKSLRYSISRLLRLCVAPPASPVASYVYVINESTRRQMLVACQLHALHSHNALSFMTFLGNVRYFRLHSWIKYPYIEAGNSSVTAVAFTLIYNPGPQLVCFSILFTASNLRALAQYSGHRTGKETRRS